MSLSTPVSSPTKSTASSSVGATPHPHEYNSIIHSLQRRQRDRSGCSDDLGGLGGWRGPLTHQQQQDLEADLRLSAQVGVALLDDKRALEKRLVTAEGANQKLLDRLTSSVKESSQLQRRLEEAVGNLENAESNNRALLVALEESRKAISRLTADGARAASAATQLKTLARAHEDVKQELLSERRRAQGGEAKVKKQGERVVEMEDRLRRAIADLEEMRQDKVLRKSKSTDAIARARARVALSPLDADGANPEAAELLKLVESLVAENDMLRGESAELHELLDLSRDEQSGLRTAIADRQAFLEEDEDRDHDKLDDAPECSKMSSRPSGGVQSEHLMSPSVSHTFSDFDRPASPGSTNPTSFTRSWAPSSTLSSSRALARTNSSRSTSPAPDEPSRHAHFSHMQDPAASVSARVAGAKRRGGASTGALGRSTGPAKVPFGRGHTRRALSMDVPSYKRRTSGELSYISDSAPPSPNDFGSSHARADSVVSTDDESVVRRRIRPLSLSLGPSLFPLVPEDGQSTPANPFPRYDRARSSVTIPTSNSGGGESGLSLSSPEKRRRWNDDERPRPANHRVFVTVDSGTQTSPPATPRSRLTAAPGRSTSPISFDTPPPSSSDGEGGRGGEFNLGFGLNPATGGGLEARTASLGHLIEHASKLLGRIQSADIATLEKRLKKQHLPGGDVRHLAQANLKDLVNDIEGLRTHFRRILEQERAKDLPLSPQENTSESLVLRRDFVSLVKLFRDLLFETSRLRALVNRVQLEPSLAANLRELDNVNTLEGALKAAPAPSTGGLLAPFSRLFAGALSAEPEPASPAAQRSLTPRPSMRPIAKLSGSSAITSATVNVEFGSGAVRRAVAHGPGEPSSPDVAANSPRGSQGSVGRKKSETQVKRDLSSIFAGGLPPSRSPATEAWVVVPPKPTSARAVPSTNPFGRLLAAYRPAASSMSTTANAVLDSFSHAPQPDSAYEPTLLERQLRPRGLSDSSIRSTFVAHANPHHRLISPATLALSAESHAPDAAACPVPILSRSAEPEADRHLSAVLSSSMRKPSMQHLRPQPSQSQLRPSPDDTAAPTLPISISISPTSTPSALSTPASRRLIGTSSAATSPQTSGSLFNNLSHWATKAAGISGVTVGDGGIEEDRGRPEGDRVTEWSASATASPRGESWERRTGGSS